MRATNIIKTLTLLLISTCCAQQSMALAVPQVSSFDSRTRSVPYYKEEVYQINGKVGYATIIEFAAGETYVQHYMGDAQAWKVAPFQNYITLKPITDLSPETNLIVITSLGNKYIFDLKVDKGNVYGVKFTYPNAKKSNKQKVKDWLGAAKQPITDTTDTSDTSENAQTGNSATGGYNFNYWSVGSAELKPSRFYDNGTHTFIKTKLNSEFPVLYAVDSLGNEELVNITVDGDWIIIPRVNKFWRLRSGNFVLCVTGTYDYRRDNQSGTISPNVERVELPALGY